MEAVHHVKLPRVGLWHLSFGIKRGRQTGECLSCAAPIWLPEAPDIFSTQKEKMGRFHFSFVFVN